MTKVSLSLHFEDGSNFAKEIILPAVLGRAKDCDLVLHSWRVAKQHAKISAKQNEIWLEDLGSILGTIVNGKRVTTYGPINNIDEIVIGNCLISINNIVEQTINKLNDNLPKHSYIDTSLKKELPDSDHDELQDYLNHRKRIHSKLISALQLKRHDINEMSSATLRAETHKVLLEIITNDDQLADEIDRTKLLEQLLDEAVGLGPLEDLLKNPLITEIMVNRYDEVFIEIGGKLQATSTAFSSEQALLGIIDRIVTPIGRRIDDSSPMVDARLKDGSRVNAIIAPLSLRGACLTIRKFPQHRLKMQDLLAVGALDANMAYFLEACVRQKKNIIVSGGTGSGKTSLLNILSNAIPASERIITIEDAAELRLNHLHQVNLEARPDNNEGKGKISIRDLVRNSLRMRPDRIVVGECRGAEAFDMLAAMNTGHEGSLTTLHANSPRDALARLETMILMAGMDLPLNAIREHIASAIDIIVQLVRLNDGRRILSSIVQISGQESGKILLQNLFVTKSGSPTVFQGCGLMPSGFDNVDGLNIDWFNQSNVIQGKATI